MVISKDLRIKVYANKRKIAENYSNVAGCELVVVVAVVKVTKMRKRIFYLTCINNAIVHISNIEYQNFQ